MPEVEVYKTLIELRECLQSHEPDVRILGNVRCADALLAIDTIITLAQRYAVLRTDGVAPALIIADVLIGTARVVRGAELDEVTDRKRAVTAIGQCPRNFWCVHEVLCSGARRFA